MFSSLPPIAANMRQTNEMLRAIAPETEALLKKITAISGEFCAENADELLWRYEQDLGLENAGALSAEQRRDRIRAALIAGTSCTPAALKEIIERVAEVSVSVIEHPQDYALEIAFNDVYGTPRFLDDIKAAVRAFKPAHLTDIYTFLYKLVKDYYGFANSELFSYTLAEMEE